MTMQRDDKILVHVPTPLKVVVRAAAEAEGRSISSYVREMLIDRHVARLAGQQANHG